MNTIQIEFKDNEWRAYNTKSVPSDSHLDYVGIVPRKEGINPVRKMGLTLLKIVKSRTFPCTDVYQFSMYITNKKIILYSDVSTGAQGVIGLESADIGAQGLEMYKKTLEMHGKLEAIEALETLGMQEAPGFLERTSSPTLETSKSESS